MSAASRLVVGLAGPALDPRERDWLQRWRPAGVILFARNCREPRAFDRLLADLRACLAADAEICADHEGGPVSFLAAVAGRPPAARTLGDLDDEDLTARVHRETGRRLRDLGLDRVLAPCCDVLTEPYNPVIGARSFGPDPHRVARHAAAAARGLRDAGLRGCAKHWPNHGGTGVDTHLAADGAGAAPAIAAPFLAALDAGLDALMLGHLPVAGGCPPLTVDREALADVRRRLGGAVTLWCDDVSMGALRPALAARGVGAGDGRAEGLADPARLPAAWLEAVAGAGADRLPLRGIPWRAFPLADGRSGPETGAAAPPAASPDVSPGPAALEARRRAAAACRLAFAPHRVLWLDATAGDRLGEAAGLEAALRRAWPRLARLDPGRPRLEPGSPYARLLVTAHRPLTMTQARLLEPLLAATGEALAAGHPSLADDVARLAGPGWSVCALADCAPEDLAPLLEDGRPDEGARRP